MVVAGVAAFDLGRRLGIAWFALVDGLRARRRRRRDKQHAARCWCEITDDGRYYDGCTRHDPAVRNTAADSPIGGA